MHLDDADAVQGGYVTGPLVRLEKIGLFDRDNPLGCSRGVEAPPAAFEPVLRPEQGYCASAEGWTAAPQGDEEEFGDPCHRLRSAGARLLTE